MLHKIHVLLQVVDALKKIQQGNRRNQIYFNGDAYTLYHSTKTILFFSLLNCYLSGIVLTCEHLHVAIVGDKQAHI